MLRNLVFGAAAIAALILTGCDRGPVDAGHQARVVLEIQPPPSEADPGSFIATQAELVRARAVLEDAADSLGLAERWGLESGEAAVERLEAAVRSARMGESRLVELTVVRPDAEEAVEIANAVAEAFVDRRLAAEKRKVGAKLERLQRDLDLQREKLDESRRKMLEAMKKHGVVDLSLGASAAAPAPGGADAEVMRIRATLDALGRLRGEDKVRAAMELGVTRGLGDPGATLANYQEFKVARRQLESAGLGSGHPKVVAVEQELRRLQERLAYEVELGVEALETKLKVAEGVAEAAVREMERSGQARADALEAEMGSLVAKENFDMAKRVYVDRDARLEEVRRQSEESGVGVKIIQKAE